MEDSHFDYIICFNWVGSTTNQIYIGQEPIRNVCFSARDVIHAIHPFIPSWFWGDLNPQKKRYWNCLQFGRVYSKKSCGEHCEPPCHSCMLRFKISHIDANLQWYLGRWKLPSTEKAFSEAQRKHKRPGRWKVKKLWWDNSSQEPVEVTNIPESLGIRVA